MHQLDDRLAPRLIGLATANPPQSYTQQELLDILGIDDPKVRSLFLSGSIGRRRLCLPPPGPDGSRAVETQGELLRKHRGVGVMLGAAVVTDCLKNIDAEVADIRYLCCVSSTGYLTPGFSALLIRELGVPATCARLDVVGMGCNGGVNALNAVSAWSRAHPGELALLVCVEVCSAAYVFDGTMRSAVVNSLFGDGAAAVAVRAGATADGPAVLRFSSRIIAAAIGAMRYDWDDDHGAFSFYLDRDIPYVVGAHAEPTIDALLAGTGLSRRDIAHWAVHSGGKKVIDAVTVNLGLTRHDVRHTVNVLRDFGNLSSASFLFALERLVEERVAQPGDYGVLMAMGPGSTIESALVRW